MASIKDVELNGVSVGYWDIADVHLDFKRDSGIIEMFGYASKSAYVSGSGPVYPWNGNGTPLQIPVTGIKSALTGKDPRDWCYALATAATKGTTIDLSSATSDI